MQNQIVVGWDAIYERAELVAQRMLRGHQERMVYLYGIPRGGIHAAQAVATTINRMAQDARKPHQAKLINTPEAAHFLVDDIIDSGATCERWGHEHPHIPFYSLVDKLGSNPRGVADRPGWYIFPWETADESVGPRENIVRLLQFLGEDVERDGLKETPDRVVRAWTEMLSGYKRDPAEVMKVFDDKCDEMVLVKNIEFTSFCEHHMLPFEGKAHVAYIPNGKVLGLSKIARVLEIYAQRLQIQERLTAQVAEALDDHLKPKGSACVIEATHFCMVCRGVKKQEARAVTSKLLGVFRDPAVRGEFFNLIGSK